MNLINNKQFWSWILIIYLICLIILSVIPNPTPESLQMDDESFFRTDYIQHLMAFALLPLLYGLSGGKSFIDRILHCKRCILFSGLLFACFTEALQLFVTNRTFNPVDMLLNATGIIAGAGILWVWERYVKPGPEFDPQKN